MDKQNNKGMTKQEIYDTVCAHLAKQKTRSMTMDSCSYRGEDNKSCAVGCLITNDEYDEEMDSIHLITGVREIFERYPHVANRIGMDNLPLLGRLQVAHDTPTSAKDLKLTLSNIAETFQINKGAEEQITEWNA